MIRPYEWEEHRLLLTVRNRMSSYSFLLDRVSQEDFFEHWCQMWTEARDRKITDFTMCDLTVEAYDLLEPSYEGQYLLEG